MKFVSSVSLLLSLASLSFAQDLSSIPTCAQGAVLSSIGSTNCQITDVACICKNTAFINSLLPALQKACSADDLAKTETAAVQLCASASVSITIPGVSATGAPASTPAATGSSPYSTTAASATGSSTPVGSGSVSRTPSGSSTATSSTSATPASAAGSGASGLQVLGGAGSSMVVGVIGLVAGRLLML